MKTCKTESEYIVAIAPAVQRACKRYGYLSSVLIAQSCRENGYGIPSYWDNPQIAQLLEHNNMVGQKAELLTSSWADKSVWPGRAFAKRTPEEYSGRMTTITDSFRIFDSIEQSFCDFILFLLYASNSGRGGSPKYGPDVVGIRDPETLIRTVAGRGYATGSTYPSAVMRIIRKHDLTRYDDLSAVEPSTIIPASLTDRYSATAAAAAATGTAGRQNAVKLADREIIDITADNHAPRSREGNPIEYIVVHYLGVPNADNPYLYGGGYGGHYNVQRNGQIYKAVDPRRGVVWHCGGGLQGDGGHSLHGICTNFNSIGIEVGVCYGGTSREGDGDDNLWFFTEGSQESLVWLVSRLMDKFGIGIDHVVRHYDVTGKICPNPYVKNNHYMTNWTWGEFKANVAQYRNDGTITIPDGTATGDADRTTSKNCLRRGDAGEDVREMQRMLIACGYSCGTSGADGDFGSATYTALRKFQGATDGLSVDGIYGPLSKAALEAAYQDRSQKEATPAARLTQAISAVAAKARDNCWRYGNSTTPVPCGDGLISCDRLIARALWDLGYRDQRTGGETCGTLNKYLTGHGWHKVGDRAAIRPGAVVAVRKTAHNYVDHVFFVVSYDAVTDSCVKYDMGSDERIRAAQPFSGVRLVEWDDRVFAAAYNPPDELRPQAYMYRGVDCSPVFDPVYYADHHDDLRAAFGGDAGLLFRHFTDHGMREGRQASASFNVRAYMAKNADLVDAYGSNLPLYYRHYCEHGQVEGRKAT